MVSLYNVYCRERQGLVFIFGRINTDESYLYKIQSKPSLEYITKETCRKELVFYFGFIYNYDVISCTD